MGVGVRSVIAVLGGLAVISLVTQPLEFSLVNAVATEPITDMAAYLAVRNQPSVLGAMLAANALVATLAGYLVAKVAGTREMSHAAAAAMLKTAALAYGFTLGDFASATPVWMRVSLLVTTGPAMLAGAAIRARAVQLANGSALDLAGEPSAGSQHSSPRGTRNGLAAPEVRQ